MLQKQKELNQIIEILQPPTVNQRITPTPEAEWIKCDIRTFDLSVIGKFDVIMLDPPWDIRMDLPYGTLTDKELLNLDLEHLSDNGVIFLWVTVRAMELGRKLLRIWGYKRVDEIVWIKTNQVQRLVRAGRSGYYLKHCKEHCLVGAKGNPNVCKYLDCDVVVSNVRATSQKPDEMYKIIDRMSNGRKLEIFGRPNNIRPGWLTLGNQLPGVNIIDSELREKVYKALEQAQKMNAGKQLNLSTAGPLTHSGHLFD